MKKQITILALGILMLAGVMATTYAGETESYEHDMNISNLVYVIVGNSSYVGDLDMKINKTHITITIPQDMETPNKFDIVFIKNQTREVEKIIYRGGGGSKTKYVDRNVTVYVPEYINNTETLEVEVEKVITKIIYDENSFKLWEVLLGMFVGLLFGGWIVSSLKKD